MSLLRVVRFACRAPRGGKLLWRGDLPLPTLLPPSSSLHCRLSHSSSADTNRRRYVALFLSFGGVAGLATAFHYLRTSTLSSAHVRALCKHSSSSATTNQTNTQEGGSKGVLPEVKLYAYAACPFCSKVKAYLKCHDVTYRSVSVNPVTREQVKFSENRKLPFVIVGGEQINDSSLIISVLRTCQVQGISVSEALQLYPEMTITDGKGKSTTERSNKYFVMYGEEPASSTVGERREEREWREWVDEHLVHALPPNIYRTLSEARKTMKMVGAESNLSAPYQFLANNVASVALYFVGKRNIKKYHLKSDARESLYDYCNQWMKAVGKSRTFMGGSIPNLADLAVYGAINATEGLSTFQDVQKHTKIGPWYSAVKEYINKH